jgi:peptidoglycan/xylan/chitin deacetylase (PgdA/CDA1 family)
VILLYHGIVAERLPSDPWRAGQAVPREDFERQVGWLARRRRVVSLAQYLQRDPDDPEAARTVALTFDDGLRSSFVNAIPFLQRHGIHATFFVTTAHIESRKLLWFSYLNALCFEGGYDALQVDGVSCPLRSFAERRRAKHRLASLARTSGDPVEFSGRLAARYPLPLGVASRYEGATPEELRSVAASDLLELGSHTLTHPFLSRLSREAQEEEIIGSRRLLAELSGRSVRYFAYPAGDYSRETLDVVRKADYEAAFATIPVRLEPGGLLEIERVGIYSPSLVKFRAKTMGLATAARRLGLAVG